jgi:hypothetical protein
MRNTVSLAEAGPEERDSHTASFEEGNVEPTLLREVDLCHLENFLLLWTENEVREVSCISVTDHKTREEFFDVI